MSEIRFPHTLEVLNRELNALKKEYKEEPNVLIKNDIGFAILDIEDAIRTLSLKPSSTDE